MKVTVKEHIIPGATSPSSVGKRPIQAATVTQIIHMAVLYIQGFIQGGGKLGFPSPPSKVHVPPPQEFDINRLKVRPNLIEGGMPHIPHFVDVQRVSPPKPKNPESYLMILKSNLISCQLVLSSDSLHQYS